ncbi:Poly [ADP-ribose] polymerase tankyrase-2 [Acropora cervicornis]|uniref:Poly [ADP-ribose] polymerase tankyrase-2 n=1 Tax=Acropora cervicornis TaxID=6130 RepID=A0AAD9QSY6_ACRCE|nr:Poly [ADP-ribose] polymerase tankyrase-2 [Acropora cervicornis]
MSLRTRINGFTAWVNLRLTPSGHFMHNILTDLLKGYNMKVLLESLTGKPLEKLQSFDGMFAMRCADQVFDLLWCLVCHDIWFVWERCEFLQQAEGQTLTSKAFTLPPTSPKSPSSDDMVTKRRHSKNFPSPEYCILDMVNAHLKMNREGRKLTRGVLSLSDLTDSRVLCALINSFVPETFTTEVLLNDRWTINLALTTANQMFKSSNPFDSQDLVEGDIMSVCCYFAFFFMSGYKFRQSRAVLKRLDLKRKRELENALAIYEEEIQFLEQNYDIAKCSIWMKKVAEIQNKCRTLIADKIVQRFEVVKVPRNMTINDLAVDLIINLSLTCGTGFYSSKVHETIWKGRKLVLKDKETGEFYDGGNADQKETVRQMLGLQEEQVVEISGDHPNYEVFPGTTLQCQRLLFRAAKTGELDTVQKLVAFFNSDKDFIKSKEHGSGNTALHMACRHGHFDIVLFLLENGADIDMFNNHNNTPFFLATESLQKEICQWGAEVMKRNKSSKTAFELMRHYELKKFLQGKYKEWQELVPTLISGDIKKLTETLLSEDHDGNTPLHVKCYGESGEATDLECIEKLLMKEAPLNTRNNRDLMPIHCCAMQGRIDAIQALLFFDTAGSIKQSLETEDEKSPPSLPHLSVANDFLDCAKWRSLVPIVWRQFDSSYVMVLPLIQHTLEETRLTAFDFITDFEEWIESSYFTEEMRARLKAYNLKHARDLVRAISKKVKNQPPLATSQMPSLRRSQPALRAVGPGHVPLFLPPIPKGATR